MITIKQLIEILQKEPNQDLPVVLYTDHGQTLMKMNGYTMQSVHDIEDYMMDAVYSEEAPDEPYTNVFVLEAV